MDAEAPTETIEPKHHGGSSFNRQNSRILLGLLAFATQACGPDRATAPSSVPTSPKPNATTTAVIAHRGSSFHAPENTLIALDLAVTHGAQFIEYDVHVTVDGEFVLMHDLSIQRTTRGEGCVGNVHQIRWEVLNRCDAGRWFNEQYPSRANPAYYGEKVPTLKSVLRRYAMSPAHLLEIKAPRIHANIEQKLAALIQEVRRTVPGADPNIVIQSFDAVFLRRYHQYDSSASLALTLSRVGQNAARDSLIVASGFVRSLIPHYADVNADLVMEARQRKMKLYVYTVNDATEMNRLLRLGVDGIITDNPPLLRAQINSMQP